MIHVKVSLISISIILNKKITAFTGKTVIFSGVISILVLNVLPLLITRRKEIVYYSVTNQSIHVKKYNNIQQTD